MNETLKKDPLHFELADVSPERLVTSADVQEYLLQHPEFFEVNPRLLDKIKLPHAQRGSVSLVERQAEQLREHIKVLQKQISELLAVARQNERIYRIYADLNLSLCKCKSLVDVQEALKEALLQQLELDEISLRLFGSENDLPETSKHHLLKKRFNNKIYYLGRLSHAERNMLFSKTSIESVAMMLLGERGEMGLLAIGSVEPHHFHPGMDTLLIAQLQQFLTLIVPQLAEF